MQNETMLMLANDPKFSIIRVQFAGSNEKEYCYFTCEDFTTEDNEQLYAVVDTPSNGMAVVKVIEVIDPLSYTGFLPLKWAVQKVSLKQYKHCKEVETAISKELAKAKQTKQREEMTARLNESLGADTVGAIQALVRL